MTYLHYCILSTPWSLRWRLDPSFLIFRKFTADEICLIFQLKMFFDIFLDLQYGTSTVRILKQNMVFWHVGTKYFFGGMGRQRNRRQCYGNISAVCFHPCGLCDNTENLNFGLHNEIERFSFLFFAQMIECF